MRAVEVRLAASMEMVRIWFPAETLVRLLSLGPGWRWMVVRAVEKELGGRSSACLLWWAVAGWMWRRHWQDEAREKAWMVGLRRP